MEGLPVPIFSPYPCHTRNSKVGLCDELTSPDSAKSYRYGLPSTNTICPSTPGSTTLYSRSRRAEASGDIRISVRAGMKPRSIQRNPERREALDSRLCNRRHRHDKRKLFTDAEQIESRCLQRKTTGMESSFQ